ncbi:MAG: sulfite exporter TauE/SafE family protein, partial [Bacteroidota bacterium]
MTDLSAGQWILFSLAGLLTGVINTLAGSGSLITLPVFIFICGLPADVANGTNRIGALFQSATGVRAFQKEGELKLKGIVWIAIPIVLGAAVGAKIAVELDEQMMNYSIAALMVFMLIVLLVNPKKWI